VKTTLLPEPPPASLVREELSLILKSPSFRGSKRCQEFLQYVVEKALDGDTEGLKERTLAIEIFGRKADADLTDDSIVRVGAREVRKRLAQYYVTDGAADPLRIDLPAGSYVPLSKTVIRPLWHRLSRLSNRRERADPIYTRASLS